MAVPYITSYENTQKELDDVNKKIKELTKKIDSIGADIQLLRVDIAKANAELANLTGAERTAKEKQIESMGKRLDELYSQEKDYTEQHSANLKREKELKESQEKEPEMTSTDYNPFSTNALETNLYNKTTDSTPLDDEDPEIVKIRNATKNASKLSMSNADIGGFEKEGIDETTGEIVVINKEDNTLFAGLKLENTEGEYDSYTRERIKYYESSDKTRGFVIPWDARLGMAYTSTSSIGNYMPYGEEWVGSPSIFNPYALIRFEHIASRKHHQHILDQRGVEGGFRGTKFKPYANIKDYVKTENGKSEVIISDEDKLNLGVYPSDAGNTGNSIYADDSGALYIDETDYSQEIWRPTKAVIQKTTSSQKVYEITDSPSTIIVNTPEYAKSQELAALNKLRKKKGQDSISESGVTGIDSVLTPNTREFWLSRQGWIKCGNYYMPSGSCKQGQNVQMTKEEQENIVKASEEIKSFIDTQVSRKWEKQGYGSNRKYLRKPNTRNIVREPLEPTYENLCDPENWVGQEQFQYRWVDFLYIPYYNKIPNNYLVTLRRYPMPTNDSATVPDQDKTKQHLLPVAQAVTYLGDVPGNLLSDLLTFSGKLNWRDIEAQVNEIDGNEQGADDSPFGSGFAKFLGVASGESDFSRISGWDEQRAKFDPYRDGMYANRIFGPVNVVTRTKARDRGLEFDHTINLNFHYSLKSLGGVNPKAAMLDIMANILALTYNNANFWGGANRYFPNKPAYPFLGGKKGMQSWYSGDVTGFLDGLSDQLLSAMGNLGSIVSSILSNPKEGLKALAGQGAQTFMATKQRDRRPAILGFKALLTGEPVGEWHLVIGNPFNPIAMIGNLICTGYRISFSDRLLADDFPDEMIATITLEHGRPRDKGDVESMFNRGGGRLHYSYFGKDTEIWNSASSTKDSKIDTSYHGNTTTYQDNFSGETVKANMYDPKNPNSGHTTAGGALAVGSAFKGEPVASAYGNVSKIYTATNKMVHDLAAKVGFKSGD